MEFSLLHATWRRPGGPREVMTEWLARADHPASVEPLFAMDDDDEVAVRETDGCRRAINPASNKVTAVRNWNAAAELSSGDVLVVIADDFFPPQGWDTTLARIIGHLDPTSTAFAVKVTDTPNRADTLLRHPVVSRAFYSRLGLFSPGFTGVYCDDDLTRRAFWRAVILDGRELILDHRHPSLAPDVDFSESHTRINAEAEYQRGRALYEKLWRARRRNAPIRMIHADQLRLPVGLLGSSVRVRSIAEYWLRQVGAGLKLPIPTSTLRRLRGRRHGCED